ncbi:cytochrome c-type biogenesis protein NrfE [Mesocricetibacter intestinalis]|uniref:Cytochrome c-type biogenesis protein NrfE n=1 Tax=Mesocricetibacter intestinalis TaxID=1521930 RepID=A0A4R6VC75_9PAST|nr:heme lyase NrfEFG subunit NrfE [Mesocricetibacter intestinalis]TDQ57863.1 cytochrome c-type biogenesis protein NrfE [Mesocricetibacter intestinalis]
MFPELGFIALLFACACSFLLALVPSVGILGRRPALIGLAWNFSYLIAVFTFISLALLAYSFAADDFSLQYVAAHSNSHLPLFFKLAATWGGHEGSMLFWLFALALWSAFFAFFSRRIDPLIAARTQAVLGMIFFAFALFVILYSNPFLRQFPLPPEGRDLNPMLQDIGLIIHPPLLYLGYVGFALNFALTVSAFMDGRLDAALARWMRPWVLLSWAFLTIGIMLGSWWAYYELGWGGWWFWDPVENASLMPWLLGLGLLHSLAVSEQRGIFAYWSLLFSLLSFIFSLLGTFIVRSGILTSVHAFAIDTQRGTALLALFLLLSLSAFSLFAFKGRLWQTTVRFSLFSRESAALLMNILIAVATASVLLGTFYPMLFAAAGLGEISVGAPYFNLIFRPLILIMLVAMALFALIKWKKNRLSTLGKPLLLLLPSALLAYLLIRLTLKDTEGLEFNLLAFILLSLAIWVLLGSLYRFRRSGGMSGLAMLMAHCGLAVTVIGAVMSGYFGSEIGVRLAPNQSVSLSGYEFRYLGFRNEIGPNYTSEKAHFEILKNQQILTSLYPERRHYEVRAMNMSEVGIAWGLLGDIYIVMGDKPSSDEFTFRLHYKPFIRWLWIGALMMAAGAFLAAFKLSAEKPR